jgi:hypothetical protein
MVFGQDLDLIDLQSFSDITDVCTNGAQFQVESMIRLILYSRNLSSNFLVSAEFAVEARLSRSKELDENNAGNDNDATQQKLNNKAQAVLRRTTNQRHRLLDLRRKLLAHSRLLGSLRAHNLPLVVQRHSRPSFAFQA